MNGQVVYPPFNGDYSHQQHRHLHYYHVPPHAWPHGPSVNTAQPGIAVASAHSHPQPHSHHQNMANYCNLYHPPPHYYNPYSADQRVGYYPTLPSYHNHHRTLPPSPRAALPPLIPPGLTMPRKAALKVPDDTVVEVPSSPSSNEHMHQYWRGRLAPLPGYSSPTELLPMKDVNPEARISDSETPDDPILLPPMSFFGSNFSRSVQKSPISPSFKLENNEKNNDCPKSPKQFQFDKYAECYIPIYLRKIQKELHRMIPLPPMAVFPSPSYIESFLVPIVKSKLTESQNLALLSGAPIPSKQTVAPLDVDSYHEHWTSLLRWELDAMALQKEQVVLWKLGVKIAVWQNAEFVLYVPNIRENHPRLEVGDLVHMREVLEDTQTGSNRAVEGRVVTLRKREGLIHIHSPPLQKHIETFVPLTSTTKLENNLAVYGPEDHIPLSFNVSFMANARALCLMENAAKTVFDVLVSKVKGINLAQQWIFPEIEHWDVPSIVLQHGVIGDEEWVDKNLNVEQRRAVSSIALYQSPVPHLISGPPGTGKTRTVVEAVLQTLRVQPEACILLCAPSNPATDTLVSRLQPHLQQDEMLRLNDPNRTFAEVPSAIMPYCYVEDDKFALPPWQKLMKYRVVVTCCLDASILVGAHCTNMALMKLEEELAHSLHPRRKVVLQVVQPHWTHLLIDEAAQGSEPELLIPISVVLPPPCDEPLAKITFTPQLALCGDINQLGPIVFSDDARSAELEVSLLERLFERPLYMARTHSELALNSHASRRPPYTKLVKNYRSHPVILMPSSAIFYDDTLQPHATNGKIRWSELTNPDWPLKFIGCDAEERSTDERASWSNPGEIVQVVRVIKSMLEDPQQSDPPLQAREIGVMAAWREQVWKLREQLRREGLSAVDVGTVEDYQGRESRVIIISCVRSNPRFLEEDARKGLGIMNERKRMNVAITRAKELLVVVGNGVLLQHDPYWRAFLQFALRNKLYSGPELYLEMDGNYISRLESKYIESGTGSVTFDLEEQGVLFAGGVAREVLRE
ncbi:P-loop containing nucleoside triphosphate hydrolase protein [Panaeolus papilionaceus]|nr:P-loop containing nucleoside triphosphate hydrolase protein [Panaeolus papilionaceus]